MARQTIDELAVIITANNQTNRGLEAAKKDFVKFAKDVQAAHPPPPKPPDMTAHKKAAKEAADVRRVAREAGESFLGFAAKVAATGGSIIAFETGLNGIAGALDQLKQSVRMAADFEQTALSFEVMLGSARRSQSMLADIRRYAATTPFNNRELTGAARQLVAYGFAAEQVMPTLKMLGDISAGMGDAAPMQDLSYLYGTLRSQGRAYTRDMLQFTNRGIPVWEQLSAVMGKNRAELQGMVEDGLIGFQDIEAAFQRMTRQGGQFYQMTARQGQTTAGVLEQMTDAFDLMKLEMGKALIEELGIKEGARDLEAFAGRLRESVGELRPAIRFAGQLGRAVAQISNEGAKAAITIARLNLDGFIDGFPGLKAAGQHFRQLVEDAAGFKLDEKEAVRFGFALGTALTRSVADAGKEIASFGEGMAGLFEMIVRSARESRDYIKQAGDWLNAINEKVPPASRFLLGPINLGLGGIIAEAGRRAAPVPPRGRADGDALPQPWEIAPPEPGMSADRIRREYGALVEYQRLQQGLLVHHRRELEAGRGNAVTVRLFENRVADAARFLDGYHGNFAVPADARRLLPTGEVPVLRGAVPPGPPDSLTQVEEGLRGMRGMFAEMKKVNPDGLLDGLRGVRDALLADIDARRAVNVAALNRQAAMAGLIGPAWVSPTRPDLDEQDRQAARAAGLGSIAVLPRRDPARQEVADLALSIRRDYDPRPELEVFRRQLDDIKSRQMLGSNTDALVSRAWRDRLGQAAGKLGIDPHGRYQLPEATTVGTAEDARMITAWRTEGTRQTSEQIWQRIALAVEQLVQIETQRGTRTLPVAPPPRVVKLTGE